MSFGLFGSVLGVKVARARGRRVTTAVSAIALGGWSLFVVLLGLYGAALATELHRPTYWTLTVWATALLASEVAYFVPARSRMLPAEPIRIGVATAIQADLDRYSTRLLYLRARIDRVPRLDRRRCR